MEPRRTPVPVTTAGQWAAMRPGLLVSDALNPDRARTFLIPREDLDLRVKRAGGTCRMWRWERETVDDNPEDGNLQTGRIVHVRDPHGRRILASGIVTLLGMDDGRHRVRDAEPHEAARVLCSEETWPGGR